MPGNRSASKVDAAGHGRKAVLGHRKRLASISLSFELVKAPVSKVEPVQLVFQVGPRHCTAACWWVG